MATDKKSFIAYADWKNIFDELPDEDAGKLIKHIFSYVNDENPHSDSVLIRAVFANIKTTLKRDLAKWDSQLTQRKVAGKASAEARKNNKNNDFNDRSTTVNETTRNPTVSDSVNVNVNVSDSVNETDFLLEKETKESIVVISPKKEIIDYEAIVQIFNSVCVNLPKVSKLSEKRKSALKNRISESSLEALGDVFRKVSESRFLNGENKSGWKADFDWILNPANYLKISEDNYKNPDHGTRNYNSAPTDADIKKSANDAVDKMFGITRSS